jgi:hypothetical protein
MTNVELAKSISSNLFADRDTVKEAIDYAMDIAIASNNPPAVITAIMVVANTIAKEILKNEGK